MDVELTTRVLRALVGQGVEVDDAGIRVPVVTLETLYEMKRDTVRYEDRLDAERLRVRLGREG